MLVIRLEPYPSMRGEQGYHAGPIPDTIMKAVVPP